MIVRHACPRPEQVGHHDVQIVSLRRCYVELMGERQTLVNRRPQVFHVIKITLPRKQKSFELGEFTPREGRSSSRPPDGRTSSSAPSQ